MSIIICPVCGAQNTVISKISPRRINVRKEEVEINDHYLSCTNCDEDFNNPEIDFDALEEAYKIYRAKHHFLTPEQIAAYRKELNLTQMEFAKLLGFGDATIQRYESGALQENSHDSAIQMAMTVDGLKTLIEKNSTEISDEKIVLINKYLQNKITENRLNNIMSNDVSIFTGNRPFDFQKFSECVMFFCEGNGQFITKLNKLLFYADFSYHKYRTVSITGCTYNQYQYGPVPIHYSDIYNMLSSQNFELTEEGNGTKCRSLNKFSPQFLSQDEIKFLSHILNQFKDFNTTKISEFSHSEDAYKKTNRSDRISYSWSSSLKIKIEGI